MNGGGPARMVPGPVEVDGPVARDTCYRCRKPAALCLCARTVAVANRTPVVVLQHRRERFHSVGTTRIAQLGLRSAQVVEVAGPAPRPPLRPGAALLFPGPGARDLAELPADERPSQLVVVDGTWRLARRLLADNPWLRELPCVRLTPDAPSRYRIRRQPADHCVSTIESIVGALRILEPATPGLDELLEVFDSMVDDQLVYLRSPTRTPRFQRRAPRPSRAVPAALLDHPERMLVVYGESAPAEGGGRQLLRWSAVRPATGDVFDRVVRPRGAPPRPGLLAHLGLTPDALAGAVPLSEVATDWSAFRRADDLVAAWHPAHRRMLRWLDPTEGEPSILKTSWSNVRGARCGALDGLIEELGLELDPPAVDGRAGVRLAQAVAVGRRLIRVAPRTAHVRDGQRHG